MRVLAVVWCTLCAMVFGAHLLRAGFLVPALLAAASPLLLLWRRRWVVRALQAFFAIAALEWIRTAALLVAARRAEGLPFVRLVLILGGVAVATALAAALLQRLLPRPPA